MSGARDELGCPSARHSLPMMSGCSVVQNGALSASLNRLSLGARHKLSSLSLSAVLPPVKVQCAPADCPQRKGLCPAPAQMCRLLDDLERARLQDLHKRWPALDMDCIHCIVERSGGQKSSSADLCRELVQAYSPWPSCHTCAGHVFTRAALGRMLLKRLQAAVSGCNKAGPAHHCDDSS